MNSGFQTLTPTIDSSVNRSSAFLTLFLWSHRGCCGPFYSVSHCVSVKYLLLFASRFPLAWPLLNTAVRKTAQHTQTIMKHTKIKALLLGIGVSTLLVAGASANTITVGSVPSITGAGPYTWTYTATLDNG